MNRTRSLVIALALALVATLAPGARSAPAAQYTSYQPWQLALQADAVVVGTIEELTVDSHVSEQRNSTFVLRVEDWVVGEPQQPLAGLGGQRLAVRKFMNWACASRYAEYQVGQRALFHLRWSRDDENRIRRDLPPSVMGAGNEGEYVRLAEEQLIVEGFCWREVERKQHEVRPCEFVRGVVVPLDEVRAATIGLRKLYRSDQVGTLGSPHVVPRMGVRTPHIERFAESSAMARRMIDSIREVRLETTWRRRRR